MASNPRDVGKKNWIKLSQLKGAMKSLKTVRNTNEKIKEKSTYDVSTKGLSSASQSPKARRALFPSNGVMHSPTQSQRSYNSQGKDSSLEEVHLSPRLKKGAGKQNTFKDTINGIDVALESLSSKEKVRPDSFPRHDYPFKRRRETNTSLSCTTGKLEARDNIGALTSFCSSRREPSVETHFQEARNISRNMRSHELLAQEEGETHIFEEDENVDTLNAHIIDSEPTDDVLVSNTTKGVDAIN